MYDCDDAGGAKIRNKTHTHSLKRNEFHLFAELTLNQLFVFFLFHRFNYFWIISYFLILISHSQLKVTWGRALNFCLTILYSAIDKRMYADWNVKVHGSIFNLFSCCFFFFYFLIFIFWFTETCVRHKRNGELRRK